MRIFSCLLAGLISLPVVAQTCEPISYSDTGTLVYDQPVPQTMGRYHLWDYSLGEGNYGGTSTLDALVVEFDEPGVNPGVYALGQGSNASYLTCVQCVLFREDVHSLQPPSSAKSYFATEGTLSYAVYPGAATMKIVIDHAVLRELDQAGTLIANGACYSGTQLPDVIFRDAFGN